MTDNRFPTVHIANDEDAKVARDYLERGCAVGTIFADSLSLQEIGRLNRLITEGLNSGVRKTADVTKGFKPGELQLFCAGKGSNLTQSQRDSIKVLNVTTTFGFMDCKAALIENEWDQAKAADWLNRRGKGLTI